MFVFMMRKADKKFKKKKFTRKKIFGHFHAVMHSALKLVKN